MKLDARITISRSQGSDSEHYVFIQIEDARARVRIVEVRMSLAMFGGLITGLPYQHVVAEVFDLSLVGTVGEHKTEDVAVPEWPRDIEADRYLKPYEVDGWIARRSDFSNPHRFKRMEDGSYTVNVTFYRNVPAPPPVPTPPASEAKT